jgi:hypothetical protein
MPVSRKNRSMEKSSKLSKNLRKTRKNMQKIFSGGDEEMYNILTKTEPSQKTIEQQVLDLRSLLQTMVIIISKMNLDKMDKYMLIQNYKKICGTITTIKPTTNLPSTNSSTSTTPINTPPISTSPISTSPISTSSTSTTPNNKSSINESSIQPTNKLTKLFSSLSSPKTMFTTK